jgi:hypothetical protein
VVHARAANLSQRGAPVKQRDRSFPSWDYKPGLPSRYGAGPDWLRPLWTLTNERPHRNVRTVRANRSAFGLELYAFMMDHTQNLSRVGGG